MTANKLKLFISGCTVTVGLFTAVIAAMIGTGAISGIRRDPIIDEEVTAAAAEGTRRVGSDSVTVTLSPTRTPVEVSGTGYQKYTAELRLTCGKRPFPTLLAIKFSVRSADAMLEEGFLDLNEYQPQISEFGYSGSTVIRHDIILPDTAGRPVISYEITWKDPSGALGAYSASYSTN